MTKNLQALQQDFSNNLRRLDDNYSNYQDSEKFLANNLIQVYQNNYQANFIETLKASYRCVCQLVGEDFFDYLAGSYLAKYPPSQGFLQQYGQNFSAFIGTIKECQDLPYLIDIAQLEYLYEQCYRHQGSELDFAQYDLDLADNELLEKIIYQAYLLQSDYPIIDIWQLDDNSSELDINKGGDNVLLYKHNAEIVVMKISSKHYQKLMHIKNIQ